MPCPPVSSANRTINIRMTLSEKMSLYKVRELILRIQKIYLALFIIFFLKTLSSFSKQVGYRVIGENLISLFLFGTVYYGLRRKRSWVIPLALIYSAYSVFWRFVEIFQPVNGFSMLIQKVFSALLLLFFAYQLKLFVKQEVNSFFGSRDRVIF